MSKEQMKTLYLERYHELKRRLVARLGNEHMAEDVLQETWMKVDQMADATAVANPMGYLLRIAVNLAMDQHRAEQRLLYSDEVESLMHDMASGPGPAEAAQAEQEVWLLRRALHRLPSRRRRILLASRLAGVGHRELAQEFGVSTRTIEKELKAALLFCGDLVERDVYQRFGPGAGSRSVPHARTQPASDSDAVTDSHGDPA
ncbi:RNA polymerase sigma factor [Isoalcanivorax beigongshangi]|uniref:RNA polymerase sigma factor n=1 Tax=Isoalcanivorax beigongshangi TaxID=3238810 RepID=A0ABV4ACV7_9GAMM